MQLLHNQRSNVVHMIDHRYTLGNVVTRCGKLILTGFWRHWVRVDAAPNGAMRCRTCFGPPPAEQQSGEEAAG